jgi:CrcB protein
MTWIAVAVGGALGSMARYAVSVVTLRTAPQYAIPFATFCVNVVGCFVIGLFAGRLAQQPASDSAELRAFVFVGILGGFTTFSTFALDTLTLTQSGMRVLAVLNVAGQVIIGLLIARAGWAIGIKL